MAAGRSLDRLAPFEDATFGAAARLLLARVHERAGERAEALAQYEAIIAAYTERKKAEEKAPAAVVNQARFAAAVQLYENGQFEKAHDLFAAFADSVPPARATGARLYQGCCEVQLHQFAQAVETLTPVRDAHGPEEVQSLLWLGRAWAGGADPEDADARRKSLEDARTALLCAVVKFKVVGDKFSMERRPEAMREGAEVHERLDQFTEAAALYARMRTERVAPEREEETLQREVTARTLAGDLAASEKLAALFEQDYPRSVLTPEVVLRRAENASLLAGKEAPVEALRRFQFVLDKYPEFEHAQNARFGLAWLYYQQGDY
jgi:tetratricopeptide (TPR) repeat protein